VDVKVVNFGHLFLIFFVHQVDRFTADHTWNKAVPGHDGNALRRGHYGIDAADRVQVKKTFVRDVVNNKANLIAVAGQHDPRFAAGITNTEYISHYVRADLIAPELDPVAYELLHVVFIAGGTGRFDKSGKESFAVRVHDGRWRANKPDN